MDMNYDCIFLRIRYFTKHIFNFTKFSISIAYNDNNEFNHNENKFKIIIIISKRISQVIIDSIGK